MLTKHRAEFLLALGAVFFSASGIIVTVILKYMPAFHLAQFRSISAVLILGTYVALTRPELLKAKKAELKRFVVYGVVGFALVNFGYLLGIERGVPLGLVLILEFTASIWIALWIKLVRRGYVANEMWLAVFLSFTGLILVSKVWNGFKFDLIGLAASLLCAFALAAYFLMSEKIGKTREPISMLIFGMTFASLFWLVVLPPWTFPFEVFTTPMNLGGIADGTMVPGWVMIASAAIFGTVVPYMLVLSGMRHLSASTSSVIGMLEPVLAGVFAWIWLQQSWNGVQLVGAAIVLVGIYIADRARSVAG